MTENFSLFISQWKCKQTRKLKMKIQLVFTKHMSVLVAYLWMLRALSTKFRGSKMTVLTSVSFPLVAQCSTRLPTLLDLHCYFLGSRPYLWLGSSCNFQPVDITSLSSLWNHRFQQERVLWWISDAAGYRDEGMHVWGREKPFSSTRLRFSGWGPAHYTDKQETDKRKENKQKVINMHLTLALRSTQWWIIQRGR